MCPPRLWCQLSAGHQALVPGVGPPTHPLPAWGPQNARSLIKSSARGTQAERGKLGRRILFRVVFMCRKRRTWLEFDGTDTKGQVMSAESSFQKSQSDSPKLNFWSPSGAHVHQALARRVIPLAVLPVVGPVPSGAKRRQGNPTDSPKLSLLVSWN